jgi:zinc protease
MKLRNLPSLWLVVPGAFLVAIAFWSLRSCSQLEAESPATAAENPRNVRTEATPRPDFETWNQRFSKQLPPPSQLKPLAEDGAGVLPNGLRYVVLRHPENPGEVSLRLQIRAGSIHENDDERGFAHFVEHLAFAPTDRRPDGNALDAFQHFGLKIGADANAHTAVDHTRYRLDFPLADDEALEAAFGFFRDVADGIRFDPEEVEKERAVILRELSEREKHQAFALRSAALFKGLRAAERLPIGLKETVETATPEKLRAFWQKHYVAPRMTLVIVGDLHEAETIARIQRHFGSLAPPPAPPPAP